MVTTRDSDAVPQSSSGNRAIAAARGVLGAGDALRSWQEDVYRTFHQHPELSDHEVRTAAKVVEVLREAGYEVQDAIGSTGVVGVLRNGEGPVVLMRADMDALPMMEETGLPYASTERAADASGQPTPVAHSCGHDVHVASLLAAARLLAGHRTGWRGTFVALFQPAEELGTGAAAMVTAGLKGLVPEPRRDTYRFVEPETGAEGVALSLDAVAYNLQECRSGELINSGRDLVSSPEQLWGGSAKKASGSAWRDANVYGISP